MFSNEWAERAATQRGHNELQARLLKERIACQKDTDAERRHETRLIRAGEFLRQMVTANGEDFSATCDVPAMAAAAVAVYERECGR